MKRRAVFCLLCLCVFLGMAWGCGGKAEEPSALQLGGDIPEKIMASGADMASDMISGASMAADSAEEVNVLGLPLMEDTALLVTVTKYRYSDHYERIVRQYEYDMEGRILRYLGGRLIPDDLDYSDIEFEYNADGSLGRLTCRDWMWREKAWEFSYRVEYNYGEDADGGISRTERKYDADGNLGRESFYDSEENLLRRIDYEENRISSEYEFDPSANQSWRTIYDEQGDIRVRYGESYDEAGNITLYGEYDKEGNINVFEGYECDRYVVRYPWWRYENTYDEKGRLVGQVQYDYEGNETERRVYAYDTAGNIVSEFFSDEMVTSEQRYEYDGAGNRIRELCTDYWYDEEGSLQTSVSVLYEREYDQANRRSVYIDYDWGSPEYRYEYTYRTIGIPEEDYPYDKMDEREYFYYY